MKKEFEPGNVKEIIDSIPERNLEKRTISTKKPTGWKGACISYADIWEEMQNCIRNGCIPAQILLSFWML